MVLLSSDNNYPKWESSVDVGKEKWGTCFVFITMNGDLCVLVFKNFMILSGDIKCRSRMINGVMQSHLKILEITIRLKKKKT